jgi:GT2 family glycosyltransferase
MSLGIIGIIIALGFLAVAYWQFSTYHRKSNPFLLLVIGVGLLLVSLFPGILNLPASLFLLNESPRGRLLFLLVCSNAALWFLWIYERNKNFKRYDQFGRLVTQSTARSFFERYRDLPENAVCVLMPSYNEAGNLPSVLAQIAPEINGTPVVVVIVDDGSTDNTREIAGQCGAMVAMHPVNRGGGAALQTGYEIVRRFRPQVVVTMDADGQHNPAELDRLVEPILNGEADLVIGSRLLGSSDSYSSLRLAGVYLFNWLINLLVKTKITDCASGYRAIRREVFETCRLQQEQYHTSEMIIEAAKRGFRIAERPIHIAERLTGQSKKGNSAKYAFNFLKTILKTWLR